MFMPTFSTGADNVPYLPKQDIEEIADAYVWEFSKEIYDNPHPFDIELFLEKRLGLTMDYQYLSHDGRFLVMTVFNTTNKVAIYDPEKKRAEYLHADANTVIIDTRLLDPTQHHRYRYTCAHECGHSIFHAAYYSYCPGQTSIFEIENEEDWLPLVQCRESDMKCSKGGKWDAKRKLEWQANYFASAILMPRMAMAMLMDSVDRDKIRGHARQYLIWLVSKTFDVSNEAAENRLNELHYFDRFDPRVPKMFI